MSQAFNLLARFEIIFRLPDICTNPDRRVRLVASKSKNRSGFEMNSTISGSIAGVIYRTMQ
jgi:hypothetical protein